MTEGRRTRVLWLAAIALAYLAAHHLGLRFIDPAARASTVWPASGVGLAALLLTGRPERRAVYLTVAASNLLANLSVGAVPAMALGALASNLLELYFACWLLDQVAERATFEKVREVMRLLSGATFGSMLACVVGAGTTSLLHGVEFWTAHRTWWIADGLGMLVLTPLAISWSSKAAPENFAKQLERASFMGVFLLAAWLTFVGHAGRFSLPPYVMIGLLAWAALRLGQRWVTLALALLALIAIWTMQSGLWHSPWGGKTMHDHLLLLQIYLGFASGSSLLFAASVSERTSAEQQSRAAEARSMLDAERLAVALDSASMGAWELHLQTGATFFSPNFDSILHQPPGGFGRSYDAYMALIYPEDRPKLEEAIRVATEQRQRAFASEHRIVGPNGEVHWMAAKGRLDCDEKGQPFRLAGTVVEVTEQKRAEHAVAASELLLQQFIKYTPAAVAMFDEQMRYLQASDRWLADYHLEGQELIGRSHYDVFPDIPQRWKDIHARALRGAVEHNHDDAFPRDDGSTEWLSWEVRPWRKPDGEIGGVVMFTLVITERKLAEERNRQLQEQLRQAQKLEALGTLAGGIAHDFNNILSAIVAYAQIAQFDNPDNTALQGQLSEVLRASARGADLVQQILSFSRRQRQERKTLSLQPVFKEALQLLRSTLPATIEIRDEISNSLPEVLADPTQMHQVLMNLCTNASHAMKGRGELRLSLSRYRLEPDQASPHLEMRPGSYVRLSVTDTGNGMSPEVLSRIFEPFFTTKASGEGTGLGLAVVHGIVKEHEGVITVDSTPGVGTTFCVYLPAAAPTEALVSEALSDVPLGHGEQVLFVDDEAALCSAAKHILTRLGYRPHVFQEPAAALEAFRAEPGRYDVLVTDFTMPGRTGLELADEVLRIRPGFPIVLASGYSATLTQGTLEEMGITELLYKPFDYRTLAAALARVVPRRLSQAG